MSYKYRHGKGAEQAQTGTLSDTTRLKRKLESQDDSALKQLKSAKGEWSQKEINAFNHGIGARADATNDTLTSLRRDSEKRTTNNKILQQKPDNTRVKRSK